MKKKLFLLISFLFLAVSVGTVTAARADGKKWFERDSRIEVVNENTVVFRDVVKIEFKTTNMIQITYVYDLDHSKLVKIAQGSFEVNLPKGDYLVQSDKRITKSVYEAIIK